LGTKTALIVGASGLVGGELLNRLLEENIYNRIVVLGRRPLGIQHPKLTERIVDFDNLNEHKEIFIADEVFSCLGTTIKKAKSKEAMKKVDLEYPLTIARLAKEMGCEKYLVVSSMGADPNSNFWYSRLKGALEEELEKVDFKALHILRPSLLLGNRTEFRLGETIGAVLWPKLSFAFVGSLRKYRAIKGKTVASCMFRVAQGQKKGTNIYLSDEIEHIGKNKKLPNK